MNNKLLIYSMAIVVACLLSTQVNAAVVVTLNVPDDFILVGEDFDVEVFAQDEDNTLGDLAAFGFWVDPSNSLSLFSYNPPAAVDLDYYDSSLGVNNVAGLYLGTGNAGENVRLATLSFSAGLIAGTDILSIEGIYNSETDPNLGLFYEYGIQNILNSIPITINTPAPLPVLLLGTGLIAIFWFKKKS